MISDPNTTHVEQAFRKLDFMLVQDIFLTDTAQLAHIVLPAAASLEKDGSFTNTERRVQLIQPVLPPPGQAKPDWEIINEIALLFDKKMGFDREKPAWNFSSTAAIMEELASVTPIYGGIRHERLEGAGLQWPCPDNEHPGTPILHTKQFSRGRGKFNSIRARDPFEQPDEEYPLILSTGRVLYHYHSGTMTRRSEPLAWRVPRGSVEINAEDAAKVGIEDGHAVFIESRRGRVRTKAVLSDRVPAGTIFMAFHWREASANILTQDIELDPVAKIPEYKICAVRLVNPRAAKKKDATD